MTTHESTPRIVRPLRGAQITSQVQTDASESSWLRELYATFAPVREEITELGITEAELDADIDAAVAAVRAKSPSSAT